MRGEKGRLKGEIERLKKQWAAVNRKLNEDHQIMHGGCMGMDGEDVRRLKRNLRKGREEFDKLSKQIEEKEDQLYGYRG